MRVDLPGVRSAAAVALDVSSNAVALDVPGAYALRLALPHAVREAHASAAFNVSKQQLTLTLPVLQPAPCAASEEEVEPQQQQQPSEGAAEHDAPQPEQSGDEAADEAPQPVPTAPEEGGAPPESDNQQRWAALHAQADAAAAAAAVGEAAASEGAEEHSDAPAPASSQPPPALPLRLTSRAAALSDLF